MVLAQNPSSFPQNRRWPQAYHDEATVDGRPSIHWKGAGPSDLRHLWPSRIALDIHLKKNKVLSGKHTMFKSYGTHRANNGKTHNFHWDMASIGTLQCTREFFGIEDESQFYTWRYGSKQKIHMIIIFETPKCGPPSCSLVWKHHESYINHKP